MSRKKSKRITLPHVQENIDKLEKVINGGNFYGAQQLYKSTSARYVCTERYYEAIDLLHSGKIPYDEDILDRVRKIYKVFPHITVPNHLAVDDDVQQLTEAFGVAKTRVKGCLSFLRAAIKWSTDFGAHRNGDSQLHAMLAEFIYFESPKLDMAKVSYHSVRGNNLRKFGSTLVNFMCKCYPGEDDIAIA
ncbi:hypothetical protein REPUB_Repub17cG0012400 [Reevesia pubescens]